MWSGQGSMFDVRGSKQKRKKSLKVQLKYFQVRKVLMKFLVKNIELRTTNFELSTC